MVGRPDVLSADKEAILGLEHGWAVFIWSAAIPKCVGRDLWSDLGVCLLECGDSPSDLWRDIGGNSGTPCEDIEESAVLTGSRSISVGWLRTTGAGLREHERPTVMRMSGPPDFEYTRLEAVFECWPDSG
jgi:hypothetical protein